MLAALCLLLFAFAQDDVATADKLYREGKYAEAAVLLEKIVERRPEPQLLLALGTCHLQTQKWEPAVRVLRRAVEMKAGTAEIHRSIGQALSMLDRSAEAIASFREAASLDPKGPDAFWIAGILARREEWFPAEHEIGFHLRNHPESVEAWELLAYLRTKTGKLAEAADVHRMLVRRKPLEVRHRLALGQAEAAARRYPEAIDALEAARRIGTVDAEALRLLSDLYLHEAMPREAAAVYSRLVNGSPRAEDWHRLGHAYLQSEERISAQEAFEKAVALDPGHAGAMRQLAQMAARKGDVEGARRLFQSAVKQDAASPVPCLALGDFELHQSAWTRAAEAYAEGLRRGDRSAAALHNLAFALHSAGEGAKAVEALKAALREHPLDERLRSLLKQVGK